MPKVLEGSCTLYPVETGRKKSSWRLLVKTRTQEAVLATVLSKAKFSEVVPVDFPRELH